DDALPEAVPADALRGNWPAPPGPLGAPAPRSRLVRSSRIRGQGPSLLPARRRPGFSESSDFASKIRNTAVTDVRTPGPPTGRPSSPGFGTIFAFESKSSSMFSPRPADPGPRASGRGARDPGVPQGGWASRMPFCHSPPEGGVVPRLQPSGGGDGPRVELARGDVNGGCLVGQGRRPNRRPGRGAPAGGRALGLRLHDAGARTPGRDR